MFQTPLMLQTRIKNRPIRCGIVILALLAVLLGIPVAAAQTVDAVAAYKRGDYATAMEGFRVHAEQGDADAQNNLGFMYAQGKGVPENDVEAVKWSRKAAEQGDAFAQYNLGVMYAQGARVPEDYVLAYAWLNLAAAQGQKEAVEAKDHLRPNMTAEQIARAQELSATLFSRINPSE